MTESTARSMPETTTRTERIERTPPVLPCYTWTVPQKPVAVRIPLSVIEKLEREAVENYRSLTSRGSEIGGLLFGSVAPGNPALVEIASYEGVPCEYTAGPLYHLTPPELARLDRILEQRRAAGLLPVGFFRSQTRKGLSLDAADLALLDSRFAGAHDIALIVRPSATKSTAGIFIREDGAIRAEASYLEFPFRASQEPDGVAAKPEGSPAPPRNVPAAPAAPMAPRPVVRAQIVPIASRREVMPMPDDAPAVREAPAPASEPPAAPPAAAAAPVQAETAPPPAPVAKASSAPAAKPEPETALVKAEPAIEPPALPAEPLPQRSGKMLWIGLGVAASILLAGGLFFSSGVLHLRNRSLPAGSVETGLALHTERNAGDGNVLLTWNRDADAIKHASRAVLAINDGPQHENVDMDISQLRTGSIVYTPATSDVVFQMSVTVSGQSQPVSETVRVLRTRPSPMPDGTTQSQAAPASGAKPTPGAPGAPGAADPAAAPAQPAEEQPKEEKVALAQAVKPFRGADSLAQRLRATRPDELPDAPPVAGNAAVPGGAGVNLGGIVGSTVAPAPAAPKGASGAPGRAASGGQIEQAQLLRRRDPEYPKLARESGAGGIVELTATVGADGKVKEVKVVRGHPLLRQAAVDAVKQWIYRPTMLNGQPVETQTQVLLNFKAER